MQIRSKLCRSMGRWSKT